MSYERKIQAHYCKIEAKQRDLSHLPPENQIIERTDRVFAWVIRLLFDAENALKPRRKLKQSILTDKAKKLLEEVAVVSTKAEADIKKIRNDLSKFNDKYSYLKEIPF